MTILLVSLLIFLVFGIPVAYSLGLSAFSYFIIVRPELLQILPQRFLSGMNMYALIALPLFILMGLLMNKTKITSRLIDFSLLFFGRFRGGLGLVNVFASMIFGGISGSSASDTASIGAVLIPEMEKRGYPKRFAAGITVASSTMGMIIPPSIPMVIYAIVAEESVGKLFLGGLIPGVMIGVFQLTITMLISIRKNYPKEEVSLTWENIANQVKRSSLALIMPVFVVGSVVFGIVTATESAAIGVLYAFIIGLIFLGKGNRKKFLTMTFPDCLNSAIMTSAKIMIVIALSKLYIWVMSLERVPEAVVGFMVSMNLSPVIMLLFIVVIILIAGTFIDVSPAILLLTPVFLPACISVGVSPIQFGVILISGLAVGAVTPPVGTCINVASAISGLGIGTIFKGTAPFLAANILTLILICIFPQLTLWVPSLF
ncbi:MAG: TRAP transporter large permease [Candidatus Marinimicrobia bacterium]|nr:TRAP transporter large permease [Candidatus Neomarinimicrobiota bacterium]MCH7763444.1 TRAP transporter large permease [Candidatus Neomarinimicrobiota bacterium]